MKNKNIDHWGKETCAEESDHIFLCCDSTMWSALDFCFFIYFIQTQKKKIILGRKINSKIVKYLNVKSVLLLFWFAKK